MLGGLFRFNVEETVGEETEGESMSATTAESIGIVEQSIEGERQREREGERL